MELYDPYVDHPMIIEAVLKELQKNAASRGSHGPDELAYDVIRYLALTFLSPSDPLRVQFES